MRLKPPERCPAEAGSRRLRRDDAELVHVFVQLLTFDVLPHRLLVRRDDRPLMYCANFDGAKCGGAATSMCTWSADTAPRTICTSRIWHVCQISSRARSATSPRKIL